MKSVAITIQAGVPALLWGAPGTGKTSYILAVGHALRLPVEVVIASIREPADFAGLPVIRDDGVRMEAPAWARRLVAAGRGILFLDEISNITLGTQAKLLQVLEEKVIRRVGETTTRAVDVRLICATNRDLEQEVAAGRFREDLFYRINVVAIHVPPLRDRVGDIPPLANYFLRRYASQLNKPVTGFEDQVITAFTSYHWPGNVRELQNVIERAVIMTQKRRIGLDDIGGRIAQTASGEGLMASGRRRVLDRNEVISALKQTNGNVTRAAVLLATHRRHLQRLIKRYQIDRSDIQTNSGL